MAQPEIRKEDQVAKEEESSLKGTLASVFIVGIIIVVFWVGVYSLYLDRF